MERKMIKSLIVIMIIVVSSYSYGKMIFDDKFIYFKKHISDFEDNQTVYSTLCEIEIIVNNFKGEGFKKKRKGKYLKVYSNKKSGIVLEESNESLSLIELDGFGIYMTYKLYLHGKLQKVVYFIDANYQYEVLKDQQYKDCNQPNLVLIDYTTKNVTEIWYFLKGEDKYIVQKYKKYPTLPFSNFTKIKYNKSQK